MRRTLFGMSVRALLTDRRGRILLLRRAADCRHWPGQWELPGGKARARESFAAALRREVAEETGLRAEPYELVHCYQHPLGRIEIVGLVLRAWHRPGPVRLSREHAEFAWLPSRAMQRLPLALPPHVAKRFADMLSPVRRSSRST